MYFSPTMGDIDLLLWVSEFRLSNFVQNIQIWHNRNSRFKKYFNNQAIQALVHSNIYEGIRLNGIRHLERENEPHVLPKHW